MRMTASARSAERFGKRRDELAMARLRERAMPLVAPERAAEAARDARRGAQRGRQARAARGLDHDRVELLVPGDLVVDRAGARGLHAHPSGATSACSRSSWPSSMRSAARAAAAGSSSTRIS